MGSKSRAAGGLAALIIVGLLGSSAPATAAPVQVVEAEGMKVISGSVVRANGAAGGRVLQLRNRGSAKASVSTDAVGAVVLRSRAMGCARIRQLSVVVDNGAPNLFRPKVSWSEGRMRLALSPGVHEIRVSFRGKRSKRCRAQIDRLRLPAPTAAERQTPAAAAPVVAPLSPIGRSVPLGASVQQKHFDKEASFEATFRANFVSMTPENEMKMEWIQPERGRWNFDAADKLVAYARANGKAVRGHALVFGTQTPPWVKRLLFTDEADQALREHISTVVGRYKHAVREWDVVNEAIDKDGTYRVNAWTEKLGKSYVERAFTYARQADPTAKLVYNEFDADIKNVKRDATVNLVAGLKAKGLVDAVGLQMHTSLASMPSREALEDTLRTYEKMGLEVQITEMDVLAGGTGSLTDRLVIQAEAYRRAAQACAAVTACTRFTVWGVSDKYSWMGAEQLPLLLDAGNQPKPALAAVREVLGG